MKATKEEVALQAQLAGELRDVPCRFTGEHGEILHAELLHLIKGDIAHDRDDVLHQGDRLALELIEQGEIGRIQGPHVEAVKLDFRPGLDDPDRLDEAEECARFSRRVGGRLGEMTSHVPWLVNVHVPVCLTSVRPVSKSYNTQMIRQ